MPLVLYLLTALALLWMVRRWVAPLSNLAAFALILFPFCFAGRALLTNSVYGPIDLPYLTEPMASMRAQYDVVTSRNPMLNDVYSEYIPDRHAVREAIFDRHEWPLWNRYILCGEILAGVAEPAVYSPFTLLACLLPIADSLTFTVAINFFIAGLGAFLFARDIGCRPSTSMIAAAGFMFSTPVAFFILWAIGGSWVFLPLVLLGARRCG